VADEKALRAHDADRAVHETVHETLNRPGRVGIPLGAITAMCPGQARTPDPDIAARKDR
jgi:maltokinase